jgi:hypothetical protein
MTIARRLTAVIGTLVVAVLLTTVLLPQGVAGIKITGPEYESTIDAQSTQIVELEGTNEAYKDKINAQRTQIAELKNPQPTAAPEQPDVTTITGVGPTVTDFFPLQHGQYRVTATIEVYGGFDGFILQMYGENGDLGYDGYVLNEITDQSGTWTVSAVFTADQDGNYYAEISNTESAWTVTFEAMSH